MFVNLDPDAEPLLDFLDPLPTLLAPYRFDELRFRTYRSTVIAANWKAVVDAFNESYHVQGLHEQILPWTDDRASPTSSSNGTRTTAACRRAARAATEPAPRTASRPVRRGRDSRRARRRARGAFLGEERAAVEELRASGPPPARRSSARTRSGA